MMCSEQQETDTLLPPNHPDTQSLPQISASSLISSVQILAVPAEKAEILLSQSQRQG